MRTGCLACCGRSGEEIRNGKGVDKSMNYYAMTDRELLHYLDLNSTDPLVRRLIRAVANVRGEVIEDLEDAGMDSATWTFADGESPGEYIQSLRRNEEYHEDENRRLEYRIEELEEELNQLRTRTIMDFVEEVQQERRNNTNLVAEAMTTVQAYKKENDRLKEQIDMWGKLNQVRTTG